MEVGKMGQLVRMFGHFGGCWGDGGLIGEIIQSVIQRIIKIWWGLRELFWESGIWWGLEKFFFKLVGFGEVIEDVRQCLLAFGEINQEDLEFW